MFRRLRKLTDFELGLTLFRAHKKVDHLRSRKPCRRSMGLVAYIKSVMYLHACRRECRRRGIDVEIVPASTMSLYQAKRIVESLGMQEPRSIYRIPTSQN